MLMLFDVNYKNVFIVLFVSSGLYELKNMYSSIITQKISVLV